MRLESDFMAKLLRREAPALYAATRAFPVRERDGLQALATFFRITRDAVASLFANGIDPMVVIRWKDLFERLEEAIDACETVANVLEGIVIKNA